MSTKRSRAAFESDLQAQQSPYVFFGTPLPPLDAEVRDDGSYVPVWKQEVTDERGRKRLHGAFTGGFSAGYFNTVGSKEGWTPSTFVSSRAARQKDGDQKQPQQRRPEDFMDDEDLADKAEAEKLQTARDYSGLGSTEQDAARRGGLADLFRVRGETMGVKLLKRMGWKEGQGIGPKVRRKARLEGGNNAGARDGDGETYLFAPEDVAMVSFVKKLDRKGLGFTGEPTLAPIASGSKKGAQESSDEEPEGPLIRPGRFGNNFGKKQKKPARGGIGMGILNDTGSDDEDPYEIGPRISYNRVIGGDKKKKARKPASTPVNPSLNSAPVFIPRKNILAKSAKSLRKCHDGRLPLDGFVFGTETNTLTSMTASENKYPPPQVPPGWKSSKQPQTGPAPSAYTSTADAAKASTLDHKARAALLGESQLPGKSVFDFLSAEARNRVAAATGKSNLPQALGEVPEGYALTPEERQREMLAQVPPLERETAVAALTRGASGSAPYADNEAKRGRYRAYLEYSAGFNHQKAQPTKPSAMTPDDWVRELREFQSCANIFKPMTGMMASRFTTSSTLNSGSGSGSAEGGDAQLLTNPAPKKPADPAEEAAKLGMYGPMTRSVAVFYPTRLLCKRFNVRPPPHVQPEPGGEGESNRGPAAAGPAGGAGAETFTASTSTSAGTGTGTGTSMTLDELMKQAAQGAADAAAKADTPGQQGFSSQAAHPTPQEPPPAPAATKSEEVDASVNEALEGKRAQDAVLKAIFGDSSDDED